MQFGPSQAEGEALIERQADTPLYQESDSALQADDHHRDARQTPQADRLQRVLRRGVVSPRLSAEPPTPSRPLYDLLILCAVPDR